ncbi:hypothetical protein [Psychrobacter sp. PAMC 21119]|uniref:hypothetical protein n=1 Tax=Psychrobacter sp. PAMC 21119 TaxID=1112209 RepID=UPI00028890F9|nr:hypothetical protein [Psychrobacter sp. PAMC 21119]
MTKCNPIPPGMDYCINCPKRASKSTRPQSNINLDDCRPSKEPLEPDWNTPSASIDNYNHDMPATGHHVIEINYKPFAIMFACGMVFMMCLWLVTVMLIMKLASGNLGV